MHDSPMFVAERFGVILGVGRTKSEAAAAARVSRVEIRHATGVERRLWRDGRLGHAIKRLGITSERGLLEAIRVDIDRVLWSADRDDLVIPEREFPEYRVIETDSLDDDGCSALEARRDAIDDELRRLRALEGQADLFGAAA